MSHTPTCLRTVHRGTVGTRKPACMFSFPTLRSPFWIFCPKRGIFHFSRAKWQSSHFQVLCPCGVLFLYHGSFALDSFSNASKHTDCSEDLSGLRSTWQYQKTHVSTQTKGHIFILFAEKTKPKLLAGQQLANRQSGMNFGALNSFLVPRDGVFHKGQVKSLVLLKIHARLCIFSTPKSLFFNQNYHFFSFFVCFGGHFEFHHILNSICALIGWKWNFRVINSKEISSLLWLVKNDISG